MNEENCSDLSVAILAGGSSRRFGADKALVQLCPGGPVLLESVVAVARSLSSQIVVIGHQRYAELVGDVPIRMEDVPGRGPLAAIETAIAHASTSRVLVLACDMPCLSTTLLRWMAAFPTDAAAVVPQTSDGRWHPLHAIYRVSCLPAIRSAQGSGKSSAVSFYPEVQVEVIPEEQLRLFDPSLRSLFSLNSPDELESARQCVSCN